MEPVRKLSGQNRLIMPFEDDERNLAMCYRLVERIGGHLHHGAQAESSATDDLHAQTSRPMRPGEASRALFRLTKNPRKKYPLRVHAIMDE
jgi:hypothetical protein